MSIDEGIAAIVSALILGVSTILVVLIPKFKKKKKRRKALPGKNASETLHSEIAHFKAEILSFKKFETNLTAIDDIHRPLIGRNAEFELIKKMLRNENTRLITVMGTGGVGKTKFVQKVGVSLRDKFVGGVWFVDLVEGESPEGVAYKIFDSLDKETLSEQTPDQEAIVELLNHRGKTLLILDNFEQIQQYADITIGYWIKKLSDVTFIVTSRFPLRLNIEQRFSLEPISVLSKEETDLEKIRRNDAVNIFVNYAKIRVPSFDIVKENATKINQICSMLEGLPLALVITASRVDVRSLDEMVAELNELLFLSRKVSDIYDKDKSIYNAIKWSFDLLTPGEKSIFLQTSIFKDGFTLRAIDQILVSEGLGESSILEVLEDLVEYNLLRVEFTRESKRFRLLVMIQEFASQELRRVLGKKIENQLNVRYAGFFLDYTRETIFQFHQSNDSSLLDMLSYELENIFHSQDIFIRLNKPKKAAKLILGFTTVLSTKGPALLRIPRLLLSYNALEQASSILYGDVQFELARAYYDKGDWPKAEALVYELFDNHDYIKNQDKKALVFEFLGSILKDKGFFQRSIYFLKKASELNEFLGRENDKAFCQIRLGAAFERLGIMDQSHECFTQAEILFRKNHHTNGLARLYNYRGLSYWHHGNLSQAFKDMAAARELSLSIKNNRWLAAHLTNLGLLLSDMGKIEKALDHFSNAEIFHKELGTLHWAAVNYAGWARALIYTKELAHFKKAKEYITRALHIARRIFYPEEIALSAGDLGRAYALQQDWKSAHIHIQEAVFLQRKMGSVNEHRHFSNLVILGNIHRALGEDEQLWESLLCARDLCDRLKIDDTHEVKQVREDFREYKKQLSCWESKYGTARSKEGLKVPPALEKKRGHLLRLLLGMRETARLTSFEYPWFRMEDQLKEEGISSIKILGYGSLMNQASREQTLRNNTDKKFTRATGYGFLRLMNYNMPDEVKARPMYQGKLEDARAQGVFNVEYTGSVFNRVNGLLFDLELENIDKLRKREIGYDLIPVQCKIDGVEDRYTHAYILSCSERLWDSRSLVNPDLLPHKKYLSVCIQGAKSTSEEFYIEFMETSFLADKKTSLKQFLNS